MDPPATPDDPHAATLATRDKRIIINNEIEIPMLWQSARVITIIVIDAPSILIVEPKGILIVKKSLSNPKRSHNIILTGMLAAELLEKNAVIPLSLKQVNTKG